MAATPLTPQDVADCVNSLGVDIAGFTSFLKGASLLSQRNQVLAQIAQAQASAQAATQASNTSIATLQTQLSAIDAQYNATFGG